MTKPSDLIRHLSLAGVLLLDVALSAPATAAPLPLRTIVDFPLGQATQRYDYESLDPRTGRLFIADLAGGRVLVVDVKTGRLVKAIAGLPRVHGVLAVPEQGRVYASVTGEDQVATIDEATLSVIARVPGGHYPDGMAWDPKLNKLYVSDEHGQAVAVIDLAHNTLLKTIPLGGDVGNTQFDPADDLVYSNNQSTDELIAIDPISDTVTARWKLPGCEENHGMLIDPSRQLAYIACQANAKLVTFSLRDHKPLDTQSIGDDPDVLAADLAAHRLYVSAESGVVSVFDISGDGPHKMGEAKLANNAHVVAADPKTHHVFFPLRDVSGQPVLRVMEPDQ